MKSNRSATTNDASRTLYRMHTMIRRLSTAGQLNLRNESAEERAATRFNHLTTGRYIAHTRFTSSKTSNLIFFFLGFLLDSANHAIKSSVKSIKSIRGAFTPPSARYRFTGSLLFHLPEAMNLFSYHYIRPVCFSSTWLFAL